MPRTRSFNSRTRTASEAQEVVGANPDRSFFLICNESDTAMRFGWGDDFVTLPDGGVPLEAGEKYTAEGIEVPPERVTIICTEAGKLYSGYER